MTASAESLLQSNAKKHLIIVIVLQSEPDISLKKGITTLDERPHKIGKNAINNIIALTTCNPKLSTIFAKFIASS